MAKNKDESRQEDNKVDDNKTEVSVVTSLEVSPVSLAVDLEMIKALNEEVERLSFLLSKKGSSEELKLGSTVVFGGKHCVIIDVDTAWEVGQKVEKSFLDEDATVLVLLPSK